MCLNVGFWRLGCLRSCKRSAFRATVRLLSEGTKIFTGNLQPNKLHSQDHTADSHDFLPAPWRSQLRFPQRNFERLVWGACATYCGTESAQSLKHTPLEHQHYYDLGMDALVIVCSWNTNGSLWFWHGCSGNHTLSRRKELWFWHGCSGNRLLLRRTEL